jgi:hypothetical protein
MENETIDESNQAGEGTKDEHPIIIEFQKRTNDNPDDEEDQGYENSNSKTHDQSKTLDATLDFIDLRRQDLKNWIRLIIFQKVS